MLISRVSIKLLRRQRPRQSVASANKQRIKYGTNIDSELRAYYAQHTTSERRAALFQRFRCCGPQASAG